MPSKNLRRRNSKGEDTSRNASHQETNLEQDSNAQLGGAPPALTEEETKKSEKKMTKFLQRAVFGFLMLGIFLAIINAGHIYVCVVIMILQALVFRELVNVRYEAAKEKKLPWFRSTQWLWFAIALIYSYGDFLHEFAIAHSEATYLARFTSYVPIVSVLLYSLVFCLSIITMKRGLYRYQVSVLTWTIVIICICILQAKYVGHNIFNGLFWFLFPCSLVICNDTAAYFCGVTMGRKFIQRPFIKLSPNKTWEGFIGAAVVTSIFGFFFSRYLAQFAWLICPVQDIPLFPEPMHCQPHYVFTVKRLEVPIALQELIPSLSYFAIQAMPIQGHAISLALFASVVSPFGGFLASAIKRAYEIKDFDSIIPGHGGFMDRLDCQFITALFTWVYYNTFIRTKLFDVDRILASASFLDVDDQVELYKSLGNQIKSLGGRI